MKAFPHHAALRSVLNTQTAEKRNAMFPFFPGIDLHFIGLLHQIENLAITSGHTSQRWSDRILDR
jgi:hypothetical protein